MTNQKDDPEIGWQIKRGKTIFSIKSRVVLLELLRTKKLRSEDLIREGSLGDWKTFDQFNWIAEEDPINIKPDKEVEGNRRQPDFQKESESLHPNTFVWWTDSTQKETRNSKVKLKWTHYSFFLATTGILLLPMVLFLRGTAGVQREKVASSQSVKFDDDPNKPQSGLKKKPTSDVISGVERSSNASDYGSVPSEPSPKRDEKYNRSSSEIEQPEAINPNLESRISNETDFSEGKEEVKESESTDKYNAVLSDNVADSRNLSPDKVKSNVSNDVKPTGSQIISRKSELDRIYDRAFAALEGIREIDRQLHTTSSDLIKSRRLIEELEVQIKSNTVSGNQSQANLLAIQFRIEEKREQIRSGASGAAGILRQQLQELVNESILLQQSIIRLQESVRNHTKQLSTESTNLGALMTSLKKIYNKELNLSEEQFLSVDYFGEFPLEVHERLFNYSTDLILAEPGFLMAYVVNAVSGLNLNKLDVPQRNLERLRSQINLLDPVEITERKTAIQRFESLCLGACGLAEMRKGKLEYAERVIRTIPNNSSKHPDIRFVMAWISLTHKKVGDAINQIDLGLRATKNQSRGNALALEILMRNPNVSHDRVRVYLQQLVKRTDASTTRSWPVHRYWLIAAKASKYMNEMEEAKRYLELADHPFLTDQIKEEFPGFVSRSIRVPVRD